ncbi:GNAT family N-acetyltransferase [Nocardioides sp.]|uniref:GNAT family N-acetyltransferase n=1 Tax=Nocardioides sp. TaxID=35761 RepID=UPI003784FAD4
MPEIRPARREDLDAVTAVEEEADQQFVPLFGPLDWPVTPGRWRAGVPGFLLVAGDPVVGFAHVMELEGVAHLEQLAVRPAEQRRGTGTALVAAAREEAARRGYDTISLCTYADVPWNAPFYARLGFAELTELEPVHRRMQEKEERMGLMVHGRRVVMAAPTRDRPGR